MPFQRVPIRSIQSLAHPAWRGFCANPGSRGRAGLLGGGRLPSRALAGLWASVRPHRSVSSPQVLRSRTPARLCRTPGIRWGAATCRVPRAVVLRYDPDEFQAPTRSLLDL